MAEEQEGAVGGEQPVTPEVVTPAAEPTVAELQTQVAEANKAREQWESQAKGLAKETARLKAERRTFEDIATRLEGLEKKTDALAELSLGEDMVEETAPPTRIERFRQATKPKEEAAPALSAEEEQRYDKAKVRVTQAFKDAGLDITVEHAELGDTMTAARRLWGLGLPEEAALMVEKATSLYKRAKDEQQIASRKTEAQEKAVSLQGLVAEGRMSEGDGKGRTFRAADIQAMSPQEYAKHRAEIGDALRRGAIK